LDGFRAISIILVVICHARYGLGFPQSFAGIAVKGAIGVTIFFVISGFLITYLLLVEGAKTGRIDLKAFYARRMFRIIPVYLLYVSFLLFWNKFENEFKGNNLLHVLTFTVNFDPKRGGFSGHFWTLSIEEQFYIFWPALLILFRKHLKSILVILITYSCVVRVICHIFPAYETVTLYPFFFCSDSIFIGALGGIIFFENPAIVKTKIFSSYLGQFVALTLFLLFLFLKDYPSKLAIISIPFGNTIISLSILFLILAYVTPSDKPIFKFLNHKIVVHIGILSYSIYIWQQFFASGNGDQTVLWRTFPIDVFITYGVSLISYYLWEKPFLKLKARLSERITLLTV
jgi:peptidoglycan/LPS O-acetylase OafA/YrhL